MYLQQTALLSLVTGGTVFLILHSIQRVFLHLLSWVSDQRRSVLFEVWVSIWIMSDIVLHFINQSRSLHFCLKPENLFSFGIDFSYALKFRHVWGCAIQHEVKGSQSVESTSLRLVQDHLVFVYACVGSHQEHYIARHKFFACVAIKVAVYLACSISYQALVQDFFVL